MNKFWGKFSAVCIAGVMTASLCALAACQGNPQEQSIGVTGVTISGSDLELNVEQTSQLTATVEPENATNKNVEWESDDTSVATVSESGLVTAVSEGVAIITVTTKDGGFEDSVQRDSHANRQGTCHSGQSEHLRPHRVPHPH